MEALRCCSHRARSLWSKHSPPLLMYPRYARRICLGLWLCVCVHAYMHMENVQFLFMYVSMKVFSELCSVCAPSSLHTGQFIPQSTQTSREKVSDLNLETYQTSKVALQTYGSSHNGNDLITTPVICVGSLERQSLLFMFVGWEWTTNMHH